MRTKLYYLMLIVLAILMEGCVEKSSNVSNYNKVGVTQYGYHIRSFTIDEHDYLNIGKGYVHSGNCKKCKQERDSIITLIINNNEEFSIKGQRR